ncbi:MAG: hypothetical protein A2W91_05605 [Bacteroidetes bacterium GWF2_38_335]|nr:MAG: hypothetical protein A2W91_05605 [Bacteroidetes bacterium GWF2_38_335]
MLIVVAVVSCKKEDTKEVDEDIPSVSAPTITTDTITNITLNTAIVSCSITNNGGSKIIERGIVWSINFTPMFSDNVLIYDYNDIIGSYCMTINDLICNSTYYVRAYTKTDVGITYGNTLTFNTKPNSIIFNSDLLYGTVTDIDGNEYKTITIGTQTWMAENLEVKRFRNGDSIPYNINFGIVNSASYYIHYNYPNVSYGLYYNWWAAHDERNIAPEGWHVPTIEEVNILIEFLGGNEFSGGKLKESGTNHWLYINANGTNESGFTALPGGGFNSTGSFQYIGETGLWWCSTEYTSSDAYIFILYNELGSINTGPIHKEKGYSIRCIMD